MDSGEWVEVISSLLFVKPLDSYFWRESSVGRLVSIDPAGL